MAVKYAFLVLAAGLAAAPAMAGKALLDQTYRPLAGKGSVNLLQAYRGQVLLVVNTASQCGFTPQYKALDTLYQRYAARGLVVMGFPSNDFAQEPGSNEAIADFCENQFAVKFPMFAKSGVTPRGRGMAPNPLYAAIAARGAGSPQWNFHKFLIARDGSTVIGRPSAVDPLDPAFVREVERLLTQR